MSDHSWRIFFCFTFLEFICNVFFKLFLPQSCLGFGVPPPLSHRNYRTGVALRPCMSAPMYSDIIYKAMEQFSPQNICIVIFVTLRPMRMAKMAENTSVLTAHSWIHIISIFVRKSFSMLPGITSY